MNVKHKELIKLSSYRLMKGSRAVGTVPNKSRIVGLLVSDNGRVTLLVIEILTGVTLHEFVAIFLIKRLANAACAVVETLAENAIIDNHSKTATRSVKNQLTNPSPYHRIPQQEQR